MLLPIYLHPISILCWCSDYRGVGGGGLVSPGICNTLPFPTTLPTMHTSVLPYSVMGYFPLFPKEI